MRLTPRKAGYATIVEPGQELKEFDTRTCGHCGHVYVMATSSPLTEVDLGGHCRICDTDICSPCLGYAQLNGCVPFKKKIEEYEHKVRFHQQVEALT